MQNSQKSGFSPPIRHSWNCYYLLVSNPTICIDAKGDRTISQQNYSQTLDIRTFKTAIIKIYTAAAAEINTIIEL